MKISRFVAATLVLATVTACSESPTTSVPDSSAANEVVDVQAQNRAVPVVNVSWTLVCQSSARVVLAQTTVSWTDIPGGFQTVRVTYVNDFGENAFGQVGVSGKDKRAGSGLASVSLEKGGVFTSVQATIIGRGGSTREVTTVVAPGTLPLTCQC